MITNTETGVVNALRTAAIIGISVAGTVAAVFTVGALFGNSWWLFDYAANFRWQMFWLLVAAAILYAVMSRGFASVAFIVAALINAWLIAPAWLGDQPEPAGQSSISIVQIDLFPTVDDTGVVSRWLSDSGADVLIVSGTSVNRMRSLTQSDSHYVVISAPLAQDRLGVVVLGLQSWPVEVFHSQGFAEPVYRISVGSAGGVTDIVTAWGPIGSNPQNADKLRARLDAVSQAVASAENPVAVIGSLGATRWTSGMTALRERHELRDATEGYGYLPTWSIFDVPIIGKWIGIPIDIVLMTPEITPSSITTGPDIGAGHLPVTVGISRVASD